MDINRDTILWVYERMVLIRKFEDRIHKLFAAGKIPGFVHLYAGEEAVGVGVIANLRDGRFYHQHSPRPRALHRQEGGPAQHDGRALWESHGVLQGQGRIDAHRRRR